jgi:hypothetical protein
MGVVLMAAGVALMFFRAFALAVPLLILGISLALPRGPSPARTTSTRTSQVRSAHLEMTLDHQSGTIDGRILTGDHEGELLSDLRLEELLRYHSEVEDDRDSIRLLETFLDNSHPEWRDHVEAEVSRSESQMSRDEAYQILGLEVGSSEEDIREAYNRLIKRVHPDHGGSDVLTAQITEARDRLLGDKK